MTIADIWSIIPIMILACGALAVLLLGAVAPGRYGTAIGVVTLLGAALWCLQSPPSIAGPTLGIALTPFGRFFTVLFSLTAAVVLLLSHDYNERRAIRGEEYPATVLFAVFGMGVLSASTNFLPLFLGLEALTFAFYILVAMDTDSNRAAEAGLKYLLLGAISAAFLAFGIVFATLAIPLAFDGRWTAAAWGVEGAALVWAGLRQDRQLARGFGYLLLIGSGVAFVAEAGNPTGSWPVLNGFYVGCLMVSGASLFSAYLLYRQSYRLEPWEAGIGTLLFAWGMEGSGSIRGRSTCRKRGTVRTF